MKDIKSRLKLQSSIKTFNIREDQYGKVTAIILAKKAKTEVQPLNTVQLIHCSLNLLDNNQFAVQQTSSEYCLQDWFL